jgi:hypothetical protein
MISSEFVDRGVSVKIETDVVDYIFYGRVPVSTYRAMENSKNCETPKRPTSRLSYHWSEIEDLKYLEFIHRERRLFDLPLAERKKMRIHHMMSKFIRTRNPCQCRSHHQKMISKFRTIDEIIQNYQRRLEPEGESNHSNTEHRKKSGVSTSSFLSDDSKRPETKRS